MDWDAMIANPESSFDAERRVDLVAQNIELVETEHASIEFVDRLRGPVGRLIHLRTRGGVPVGDVAYRVEPSYVLVDEGEGSWAVVPVSAATTVASLAGLAPRDGRRRPTLTALMREAVRRRAQVRLMLDFGGVVGRLVRVEADHIDAAVDPEGGIRSHRVPRVDGAGVVNVMAAVIEVPCSR